VSFEAGIPDLLRRFVATPHTFSTGMGEDAIRLETNDPMIVDNFRSQFHNFPHSYTWKLIRDDVTSTDDVTTVFVSGSLVMVLFGIETCVVVDRDCRRVFGFLACDVDASEFLNRLSPILAESAVATDRSAR
jgi:hypothetical protein